MGRVVNEVERRSTASFVGLGNGAGGMGGRRTWMYSNGILYPSPLPSAMYEYERRDNEARGCENCVLACVVTI